MKRLWKRGKRVARYWYILLLRIKAPAHAVAMGLALGVFVGFLPVIPFQTVLALALAFLCKSSKLAAMLGTWISNPADVVFLYFFAYRVGDFLLPFRGVNFDGQHLAITDIFSYGWQALAVMGLGGIVLGVPAGCITYFVSLRLIRLYHARRMERWKSKKRYKT